MSNVTVMRLDIVLNTENLELEAEMQSGKLFDEEKVKELSQKFLEDIHNCIENVKVGEIVSHEQN